MSAAALPFTQPHVVLAVMFALVLVMPRLAERARLPGLAGLLAGGFAVGPFGFGLVERDGAVEIIGAGGLLFLMFQAGREMDLDEYVAHRRGAVVFGVLSFAVPFIVAVAVHRWLGFSMLAGLLLAACWASHTLLAYPVFQRARVVRNRAVAVAVGGTIITDTTALLSLVLVAAAHQGTLEVELLITTVPAVLAALGFVLVVLPRLTRWFFRGIGQERSARLLFVLVALFGSASLAQAVGLEAIIGAFGAGLALNRAIPDSGTLSTQLDFLGDNLFVPFFLLSVGMLLDPVAAFTDPTSLRLAAGFTFAAVVGKGLAAVIGARVLRFGWAELGALFSLSVAQAAATLAVVFVGLQIELIEESTVNAVIVVIVVTCVLSSFVAQASATRLPVPPAPLSKLGRKILVPVSANSHDRELMRIAASVAAPDSGTVVALSVLQLEAGPDEVARRREHLQQALEPVVLSNGAEFEHLARLDVSASSGILHAAVEVRATCIAVEWKGWTTRRAAFFGAQLDTLVTASPAPIMICRPGAPAGRRVVLAIDDDMLDFAVGDGVRFAATVAGRLAERARLPLVLATVADPARMAEIGLPVGFTERVERPESPLEAVLGDITTPGDVIVTTLSTTRRGLGATVPRLARALPARTLIATVPR